MRKKTKSGFLKILPAVILGALGATGGYLYYRFVGCASGACPIASDPYISTVYGGIIGVLLGMVLTPGACCSCAAGKCEEKNDA